MEIRNLIAEDLFKLAEIAEKVSGEIAEKVTDEINEKKLGLQMALSIMKFIPNEIRDFLAHVTDQTPEELDKKPFTEPLKIVKALFEKQDFKDFLQELKSLQGNILKKQQT